MHVTTKPCSCCSVAKWCLTLCDPWPEACQASLSFLISWSLLKLTPFNHLILCHPLLILLSIFPRIRVFSNELTLCIRWPKYWSFSISPANEYSGLISFRVDWFDLLAVQGTLMNLLQHQNLKASLVWCSAFFVVKLSHPYMTTRKARALAIQTFVSKVTFLLFNTLSRFVRALIPRSKHLLISWVRSPSTMILEPRKKNLSLLPLFSYLFDMNCWDWLLWS